MTNDNTGTCDTPEEKSKLGPLETVLSLFEGMATNKDSKISSERIAKLKVLAKLARYEYELLNLLHQTTKEYIDKEEQTSDKEVDNLLAQLFGDGKATILKMKASDLHDFLNKQKL